MAKSKEKTRSKGKSKSKSTGTTTPPKYTPRPPTRGTGTPGANRRIARREAGENAGGSRGRGLSQVRRGGNRRGKP